MIERVIAEHTMDDVQFSLIGGAHFSVESLIRSRLVIERLPQFLQSLQRKICDVDPSSLSLPAQREKSQRSPSLGRIDEISGGALTAGVT